MSFSRTGKLQPILPGFRINLLALWPHNKFAVTQLVSPPAAYFFISPEKYPVPPLLSSIHRSTLYLVLYRFAALVLEIKETILRAQRKGRIVFSA